MLGGREKASPRTLWREGVLMAAASKPRKEAGKRATRGSRRANGQPAATAAKAAESTRANGGVAGAARQPLLEALIAARNGDFSIRLPARKRGIVGELAAAYN